MLAALFPFPMHLGYRVAEVAWLRLYGTSQLDGETSAFLTAPWFKDNFSEYIFLIVVIFWKKISIPARPSILSFEHFRMVLFMEHPIAVNTP